MRLSHSYVVVAFAALSAVACATANTVQLADGSTGHDVSCYGGAWACKGEAERVCGNRPYVVLDDDPMLEIVTKGNQGAMRVQCLDDYVAANTPAPASAPVAPRSEKDAVCRVVYREVAPLAKSWAAARDGEPKVDAPPEAKFVDTCTSLPHEAQLCLAAIYRHAHPACPKVLGSLDDDAKARLDATLLASRRPEPSSAPPPGTLDL